MKKLLFILLICFMITPFLSANDDKWRIPDRSMEFGIAQTEFGFSNSFFNLTDIFNETIIIDIDKLNDGFVLNFDLDVTPLYFSFNSQNNWGFGFSAGTDVTGNIDLSGNMLTFKEAINEKSDFAMAAFAHAQLSGFFNIAQFTIKLAPSVFFPVIYSQPSITYNKNNTDQGTVLVLDYKLQIFSAMSQDPASFGEIKASPGFDISLGVEYPLAEAIGLKDKIGFLDFSLGLDIFNFPMVAGQLQDYMVMDGRIGSNVPIDILKGGLPDDFILVNEAKYGVEPKSIKRPFNMHLWADWRPFGFLGITPAIGFSLNDSYLKPFSFEGGLKARFDLANFFVASVGVGYYDRVWINSLDLALNLRAFELNLGVNLRSNKFAESWLSGSPGARFGLKFGW